MTDPILPRTFDRRDVLVGILTLPLGIALSGCGSGNSADPPAAIPTPTADPAAGTLTVIQGIGAVSMTAGATRDVFANADPPGMVFDRWSGDTSVLLTPGERRSGATAPPGTRTVTAAFKTLAEFTPQTAALDAAALVNGYWFFPIPRPRGVIFRFHGSGGNGGTQFSKVEERKFARDAVGSGFAVVSLDSNDRVNKKWDSTTKPTDPSSNVDIQNIQKLISNLTMLGQMDATTPCFGSGHSDGAGAALRFAFLLGWKASHQSCVPGTAAVAQATTVPGIWTMAQNDTRADPQRNASALANSNALAARQIPTQYMVVMPSAVYPSRFTQIAGISLTDSTVIYNAIKAAGKLDANDFQISDPNDVDFAAIVPAVFAGFYKDIGDELNAAYTAHQFSAATARRVLDFFIAQL